MQAGETLPTVSVAVLNHRRPHLLERVLSTVSQLEYPSFEVVVVGDQQTLAQYELPAPLSETVKYVHFAEPNICRARNHAIRVAGGEIIAFIDDDAVPEPDWAQELVQPFSDPDVATAGGTVRASNGVTLEWQGGTFDRTGTETPLSLSQNITVSTAAEQHRSQTYLSLRGVNSAFRRTAVLQAGGFDEAIRYYLDETDMALRLADTGWSAAIVRSAEVHHLLVPNATRGLRRKPGNQHEIGAAKALFCKKHCPELLSASLSAFKNRRLAMLDPQMRLGIVRTTDRDRVIRELEAGFQDGAARQAHHPLDASTSTPKALLHVPSQTRLNIAVETGWNPSMNTALSQLAIALADQGHRVSRFSFRSGWHPVTVGFRNGVWVHSGGTWTLPNQSDGGVAIGRRSRSRSERRRVEQRRSFDAVLTGDPGPDDADSIELPGSRLKVSLQCHDHSRVGKAEFRALLQCVADGRNLAQSPAHDSIAPASIRIGML